MIIIDRFEGDRAVLEVEDEFFDVLRSLIPEDAKEGDVLSHSEEGYAIDREATEERRKAIREKLNGMLGKND